MQCRCETRREREGAAIGQFDQNAIGRGVILCRDGSRFVPSCRFAPGERGNDIRDGQFIAHGSLTIAPESDFSTRSRGPTIKDPELGHGRFITHPDRFCQLSGPCHHGSARCTHSPASGHHPTGARKRSICSRCLWSALVCTFFLSHSNRSLKFDSSLQPFYNDFNLLRQTTILGVRGSNPFRARHFPEFFRKRDDAEQGASRAAAVRVPSGVTLPLSMRGLSLARSRPWVAVTAGTGPHHDKRLGGDSVSGATNQETRTASPRTLVWTTPILPYRSKGFERLPAAAP